MKDARAATRGEHRSAPARPAVVRAAAAWVLLAVLPSPGTLGQSIRPTSSCSVRRRAGCRRGAQRGPAVNRNGLLTAYSSDAAEPGVAAVPELPQSGLCARHRASPPSWSATRPTARPATGEPGQRIPAGDQRRRPLHRLLLARQQSHAGRHQRLRGRLRRTIATGDTIELISRGTDGPANGASSFPQISGDGRYVVFQSNASNLVADDSNSVTDIFVYDRADGIMRRVSVSRDGRRRNGPSITPEISDDGRFVAFASRATNLVAAAAGRRLRADLRHRLADAVRCSSGRSTTRDSPATASASCPT